MVRSTFRIGLRVAALGMLAVYYLTALAAGPAGDQPSTFAPAKALEAEIDRYLGSLTQDLADADEYGDEQRKRVAQDASTLVVLAQVLAVHDEDSPRKSAAPAVVAAAGKLASAARDHTRAAAALDEVKKSLASKSEEKLELVATADLAELMKQVPIVNNNLRRQVAGRRFDRAAEQCEQLAATLAAIAHCSMLDDLYCEDEEAKKAWDAICVDMRNAAAQVAAACRAADQKTALAGLETLVTTCDACHHKFRD